MGAAGAADARERRTMSELTPDIVKGLQIHAFDNAFLRATLRLGADHMRYAGKGYYVGLSVNK